MELIIGCLELLKRLLTPTVLELLNSMFDLSEDSLNVYMTAFDLSFVFFQLSFDSLHFEFQFQYSSKIFNLLLNILNGSLHLQYLFSVGHLINHTVRFLYTSHALVYLLLHCH